MRQAVAGLRGRHVEAFVLLEAPWERIMQAEFDGDVATIADAHYLFDSHLCTPSRGNEKGSVEDLVG